MSNLFMAFYDARHCADNFSSADILSRHGQPELAASYHRFGLNHFKKLADTLGFDLVERAVEPGIAAPRLEAAE